MERGGGDGRKEMRGGGGDWRRWNDGMRGIRWKGGNGGGDGRRGKRWRRG